jgi:glycosyltransferase involved in cell wall biosynthesis
MRIGIDLSIARVNQAGTGIYAQCLFESLKALGTSHDWVPFAVNQEREMSAEKTLRTRLDTLYRDLVWTHVMVPLLSFRKRLDLLHMPANVIPLTSPCPTIATILDTTVFRYPSYFPRWQRTYHQIFVPLTARRARKVLTISEHSKQDIVDRFGIQPGKVVVTYLAALPAFKVVPAEAAREEVGRRGLGDFILTVGTLEPRKNMIGLLRAFALLRKQGHACQLVHAGSRGWMFDAVLDEVARLGLSASVHFLGRVALEELVVLYNAAMVAVYPSFYEGFGLPVLEAMACGCPIITSDRSSLPEIAGDAAVIVDPEDTMGIALAIKRLIEDKAFANEMRRRGLERAGEFSWERCAQQTLAVYGDALEI